jgi:glycosyltransferase involved in cell wall biosynthesis
VATVQGLDYKREKWGPIATAALRAAAQLACVVPDETVVVSRELERAFTGMGARRLSYVPNGVDLEEDTAPAVVDGVEPGYALFLGRLVPEKGVATLIEAYRSVPGDTPLLIVGEGSHTDDYVARVGALAAGDPRVRLLGARYGGEKLWLLQNARLFVQPSTVEGLPIALLEAVGHGCPALVSDLPANLEPVTHGERVHARTFRRGDVADLAEQLTRALGNGRVDTSDARRLVREAYDWRRIAADVEAVYRRALARRAR